MLRVLYFCLALSFCILQVESQSSEYTWEDYDGTIPEKAFMASDDPNNPIYVGMAKVGKDNCTGTLFPGAKELMVSCNKRMHKIKEGIKILTVNDPKKIKWFPTPRANILWIWKEIRSVGEPVTCGISSITKAATLVARTKTDDDGSLVVGYLNKGKFYLIHNNTTRAKTNNYEILIIVKEPVPEPPQSDEYTWEDYDGTIPEKALSASVDPNNPEYVGLALIYRDYCPGSLLPGATEITVECGGKFTVKENLKILTVNDPKKFKWLPAPRKGTLWDAIKRAKGKPVTSGKNLARENTTTLVGRTITDDGTLDVGHYNNGKFFWIHNNSQRKKTSNYDVLIVLNQPPPTPIQNEVSKEPSASEVVLNPAQPTADANLDVEVSKEPSASEVVLNPDQPTADANLDVEVSKEPSASEVVLNPDQPTADANLDVEVSKEPSASEVVLNPDQPTADANLDVEVSKEPSASEVVLNPAQPTADANLDVEVSKEPSDSEFVLNPDQPTADANLDVEVSKEPSASEVVLNPDQPTADANLDVEVSKEPSDSEVVLNPDQPTANANLDVEAAVEAPPASKEPTVDVDTNVDIEADANAQVVPKSPPASKEPATLTPSELTVDANVDLEADADAQVVPKLPPASKEPATLTPSELVVNANVDLEADANPQVVPKPPSASKESSVLNPSKPTFNTNVDLKVEADAQTAPKAPLTPKAPPTSKHQFSKVNPFVG